MPDIEDASTLADVVRVQGKARGDATAFEFEGRVTSFAEFDVNTNKVGNALLAMGGNFYQLRDWKDADWEQARESIKAQNEKDRAKRG